MKIFVVMLLLANIASWGWQLSSSQRTGALSEDVPFVQMPSRLVMLDEMSATPRVLRPADVAAAGLETSGQPVSLGLSAEEVPVSSESGQVIAQIIEPLVLESWCAVTDVLSQVSSAEKLLAEWRALGGLGEVVSDREPVSSTWWVHLPPFLNEQAAEVVLTELQGKKIDSYYMRTGELAGGISLGVFSREASARKVQAELAGKGYSAEVREIERMEERSRLYLILENGGVKDSEPARQVLAKFDSVQVNEIPCK